MRGLVAADMRAGLLALAVGTGLQVMTALMEADVTSLAGPRGKHKPSGSRCGTAVSVGR